MNQYRQPFDCAAEPLSPEAARTPQLLSKPARPRPVISEPERWASDRPRPGLFQSIQDSGSPWAPRRRSLFLLI